jgi:hypothetical protein
MVKLDIQHVARMPFQFLLDAVELLINYRHGFSSDFRCLLCTSCLFCDRLGVRYGDHSYALGVGGAVAVEPVFAVAGLRVKASPVRNLRHVAEHHQGR